MPSWEEFPEGRDQAPSPGIPRVRGLAQGRLTEIVTQSGGSQILWGPTNEGLGRTNLRATGMTGNARRHWMGLGWGRGNREGATVTVNSGHLHPVSQVAQGFLYVNIHQQQTPPQGSL